MLTVDTNEIWKQIPPEEKFEMMNKAHSTGVLAAVIVIVVASTVAVGLQIVAILWASLIMSPFIFQFAAGKVWRDLRPRTILEYLGARAAARRYAFTSHSKDLSVSMIFRGHLERQFDNDAIQEALEAAVSNTRESAVWVALFHDAVIMMSEKAGGAQLKFSHLIDDKLKVEATSPDGADYSNNKELSLTYKDRSGDVKRYKLTSRYPAALIVFEKKLLQFQQELSARRRGLAASLAARAEGDEDNEFLKNFPTFD
jgi:hypothetical protein